MRPAAPLEVEFSGRTQLRSLLGIGTFLVLVLVAWVTGAIPAWLGAAGTAVFGGLLVLGLVTGRRLRARRPAARLDLDGITVPGAPTVPWSDLVAVVVGPLRPRWLVGSPRLTIVSFLPRPGVELPGPPQPSGRPLGWAGGFRRRVYGTNLLLATWALSVGATEIAGAAHELGGLPVQHEPHRGLRDRVLLLVAAVILGAGAGLVLGLSG